MKFWLLLTLFIITSLPTLASSSVKKEFSYYEIQAFFLQGVFSKTLDTANIFKSKNRYNSESNIPKDFPTYSATELSREDSSKIHQYVHPLHREDFVDFNGIHKIYGIPKHYAVNKWTKQTINVSLVTHFNNHIPDEISN